MTSNHRGRPRLFKAAVATTVAAALGLGLALVGVSSASAHTGTLNTNVVCSTDGATRTITYTGTTNSVPASGKGHTATLRVGELVPANSTISGVPGSVVGNTTYSFTQTVPGTTLSGQATAFLTWGDDAKSDPIGKWTASTPCAIPDKADAVASASSTPATCTVDGSATFAIENARWDDANDVTDGSRTATAFAGHTFAGGSKTTTVTYTPVAKATGNQSTDPAAPCYVAPPKVTHPVASLDHQGVCYANGDHSSENVYVTLDNTGSNVPVRFVGNGIDQIVAAGEKVSAEANPIWQNGGGFDVEYFDGDTKIGSDHIDLAAFEDCGAAYVVHIQDYNTCTLNAFVLDNTGSNRTVVYDINGQKFTVPAGKAIHTDADGSTLTPNEDGKFVITTDHGETWTFSAKTKQDCTEKPEPKVEVTVADTGSPVCGVDTVPTKTTTTTTNYDVWNSETSTWDASAPVVTVEQGTRPATDEEQAAVCPKVITEVVTPTAKDSCGVTDDGVNPLADTDQYTWLTVYNDDHTHATVTAIAKDGFVFGEGAQTEWGFTFTDEACGTDTPPTEEPTPPATTPPTNNTPAPTCDTVGAVNIPKTSPLYSADLDADGDGVACESASPVVNKTPTATPAPATPVSKAKAVADGQLAYTGSEGLIGVGVIALVLLLAGVGIAISRRRKA